MTTIRRSGDPRPAPARPARPAHPWWAVPAFCGITFTVSWVSWFVLVGVGGDYTQGWHLGLYLLGGFGPTIGMLVMRFAVLRRRAPRLPGRRLSAPRWLALAALLGAAPTGLGVLVGVPFGEGPLRSSAAETVSVSGGLLLFAVVYLIAGPVSEEPGWSGFLYPHLRHRLARLRAVAVYGPVWALWHLPLFFVDGTSQQASTGLGGVLHFAVACCLLAYLFSAANHRGGVLAAITAHYAYNVSQTLLQLDGPIERSAHLLLTFVACVLVHRVERRGPDDQVPRS